MHPADVNALAARLGWLPSFPQFTKNSLDLVKEARENGAKDDQEVIQYVVEQLKQEKLEWAIENPDDPRNFPKGIFQLALESFGRQWKRP